MNQNTPDPGLAFRWPHPCSLPIEWGSRGCPSNVNLRPRWYWTPKSGCRQGTEMGGAAILSVALWLTPEESAGQRLWRGQRHHNRLRATSGGETRGYRHSHYQSPHAFSGIFACGSGRSPGYVGWPLINLFLFITTFDLIWFYYYYFLMIIQTIYSKIKNSWSCDRNCKTYKEFFFIKKL